MGETRGLKENVMSDATLFELPPCEESTPSAPRRAEETRVVRPMREQLRWAAVDLESTLPQDHRARAMGFFGGDGPVGLL